MQFHAHERQKKTTSKYTHTNARPTMELYVHIQTVAKDNQNWLKNH